MLIWRGLKPAAIVAAMLSVQSEWKRTERGRPAAPAGSSGVRSNGAPSAPLASVPEAVQPKATATVPRLVLLDGAAVKSERPLS
ncbi:MAG: hypothetical protein ACFCUQ_19075 [Kiloniellales bacterium]